MASGIPEKRSMQRERKRFLVNFKAKGIGGVGFTGNLSSNGMHLHTKFTAPPGSIVQGQISLPDGAKMDFQAEVRWVHKATGQLAQLVQSSMGLKFIGAPSEAYFRLFANSPPRGKAAGGP